MVMQFSVITCEYNVSISQNISCALLKSKKLKVWQRANPLFVVNFNKEKLKLGRSSKMPGMKIIISEIRKI
jgi:hypothetical protein